MMVRTEHKNGLDIITIWAEDRDEADFLRVFFNYSVDANTQLHHNPSFKFPELTFSARR